MAQILGIQNKIKISLGTKFILLIIGVLSITMSVDAFLGFRSQQAIFLENLRSKAELHGKFVATASIEALLTYDYTTLNNFMKELTLLDDIVYSVTFSKEDKALTSFLNRSNHYVQAALAQVDGSSMRNVLAAINKSETVSMIAFPVMFNDSAIATVRIGIDYTRLNALARTELMKQLVENVMILIFLSVCIYIVFTYRVLRPIHNLLVGSERVATGNLDHELEIQSMDELGRLTKSFNEMMQRLKLTLAEKDDVVDQLNMAQMIAHIGHWSYNPYHNLFHVSEEIYKIIEMPSGTFLSPRKIIRIIHSFDRKRVVDLFLLASQKARPSEMEFKIILANKIEKMVKVSINIASGTDERSSTVFGTLQDISDIKYREKAVREALLEKIYAESANEAKSAFLANMSHEIRTPLTAIIGFAEASLDEKQTASDRLDAIHTIVKNSKHLLHVINEILDFSKIESRKLEVELRPTSLFSILEDTALVIGLQANEKGLSFSIDYQFPLPQTIVTDETRFKQVLLNLCSNAVKFTHKGKVNVIVGFSNRDEQLQISVVDSGVGIALKQQAHIFEPFQQADSSTTRRFGGTGLGLHITKQFVEKLGGSINIQSIENLGTRVEFTINTGIITDRDLVSNVPKDLVLSSNTKQVDHGVIPLKGKVLIAEDSLDNQKLISLYIRKTGAEAVFAENGSIAVDAALEQEYDLILMDMQMPIMDGIEATKQLRKSGYSKPIVALTANATKADRQKCLNAGCETFLTKPIDCELFYTVLNKFLVANTDKPKQIPEKYFCDERSVDKDIVDLALRFIRKLPAEIAKIRSAIIQNDWETIERIAHHLKGNGGNFGYMEITDQAGQLELAIREHNYAYVKSIFNELAALCADASKDFLSKVELS